MRGIFGRMASNDLQLEVLMIRDFGSGQPLRLF
jgi:hypothetical protein